MTVGTFKKNKLTGIVSLGAFLCLCLLLSACSSIDPGKVDVELKKSAPEAKLTSYTQALSELGLMTQIYGTGSLKIQSNPIGDNTGTAQSTGGEIPRDITEIIKSSLNSIGGNVVFIPYDPAYMQNQMVTGYSSFDDKIIPDVVLSGGITEFDRGLETRGDGTDVGAEAEFTGMKDWLPSKQVSVDYSSSAKQGLARITLDFNLLNFKTMAGIARMNTVNSMEVSKAMSNKELGITIFGPTFGRKGSIKKVQGRHAAVRLLVELSMIQIVGKYLALPYWRLLGNDHSADDVVISEMQKSYYSLSPEARISLVQEWLFLHGYDIEITGQVDDATVLAMKNFDKDFELNTPISVEAFVDIYTTIPINQETLGRRNMLAKMGKPASVVRALPAVVTPIQSQQPEPVPVQQVQPAQVQQQVQEQQVQEQPVQEQVQQGESQQPAPVTRSQGIGRMLNDADW